MSSILFVGGLGPNGSHEELHAAFSEHQVPLLAYSVIRHPGTSQCIGHAYVTVAADAVGRAMEVTKVGINHVSVFPVEVDAWVELESTSNGLTAAAPATAATADPSDPLAAALAAPHSQLAAPPVVGAAAGALTAALAAGTSAGTIGMDISGLPSCTHAHLQAVLDEMRSQLAANPRMSYNGKTFFTLLHEVCQKLHMTSQAVESQEGGAFTCSIAVSRAGQVVCSGRGPGPNKRDAKHNAAACCLDAMILSRLVTSAELIVLMTTVSVLPVTAVGMEVASLLPAAANAAISQTQTILRLGHFPRCTEVMAELHATETGRTKTILMVLNEFAAKCRWLLSTEEQVPAAASGPFRYMARLTNLNGQTEAEALGPEVRSKQEAKQAAAAAMVEHLLASNRTTAAVLASRMR